MGVSTDRPIDSTDTCLLDLHDEQLVCPQRSQRKKGSIVMAGPSSFVPSPVTPSKNKRRFSLEQANKALPLVSRIVRDIVATHQNITTLQAKQAPAATGKGGKVVKPAVAADKNTSKFGGDKELEAAVDRLQGFVDELMSIGVELKDYQTGLVDFIGRHQGRDVYLCWKLGEESVTHWHELHTGFAGRLPVSQLDERE